MIRYLFFLLLFFTSCKTTTYYVVRHAEKETGTTMMATTTTSMTSDVPLSAEGKERAEALKNLLVNKGIKKIYSTNTLRTRSTAKPLSETNGVMIQTYSAIDSNFINSLKSNSENTLIVGHSNTVDELVNGLTGKKQLSDLSDDQYGDLFVVKRKGTKYSYQRQHFGK